MSNILNHERAKVTLYSIIIMSLTSLHHVYGAIIYHTQWRLHVLLLSIPVIVITLYINRLLNPKVNTSNNYLFWIYRAITLLVSIILIGLFEGIYNHIVKNILFFGGASKSGMSKLFPPGMYEMPDDAFFEITGVMQGVIGIVLIVYFIRLTREIIHTKNS
ncbi:hypothetical protein SAMN05518672_115116 [Chitinophaga sp. CF118]|uniref:hypothetical protein n=1 Tax=Chitinophaga sp. CF118 TaxID=1884367 RepID=UPI0008E62110|nr:hypothetical protein [Chitinophaga sp. CF118]SFF08241.1 hypothetical protein SAMN05518672_115116 [Chitinophaga sp. CF118]